MPKSNPSHSVTSLRKKQLRELYKLTPEAYTAMLEAQNFSCKICRKPYKQGKYWSMDVDHDHRTGRVRGLLCRQCNIVIGMADDNPVILLRAIQYLKGNL